MTDLYTSWIWVVAYCVAVLIGAGAWLDAVEIRRQRKLR